jgi:hypothetical protein
LLKVSIPTVYFFSVYRFVVPSLSQVQVELLKGKYPNSSHFFWCCRLCSSIIIPRTSRVLSKSIPTVCFFLVLQVCAVPSLSQVQVELLKVKVSQQFTWCCRFSCTHHYPNTSRIVESKSIPTVCFFLVLQVVWFHHYPKYKNC